MLPERWRVDVVDMVRGQAPVRAEWFTGNAVLSPEERLGVYRQQYRLRLLEALESGVPGLVRLLGEGASALLWDFVSERPSSHWTLERVTLGLPEWLEDRGAPTAQVEMARLDLAVSHGFAAADGEALDPASLSVESTLVLVPHASLLWLEHDVHRVRVALADGETASPEGGPFALVVFRSGEEVRHRVLEPGAWQLLRAFTQPRSLVEAVDWALEAGVPEEALSAGVGAWLELFASRGLLQPV